MRKLLVMAAGILALLASLTAATPVAADGPFCGIRWGSLAKQDLAGRSAPVTGVRAGRHECFDRLVFDLGPPRLGAGPGVGYRVDYLSAPPSDPPGAGAALYIDLSGSDVPPAQLTGFTTLRFLSATHTERGFDGVLGVRARLPFRVFALEGPGGGSRLAIDVAHRW